MDYAGIVEPAATFFRHKASIRRAIEAEGIPYTIVQSYGFAGYYLRNLGQPNATAPPRDKVVVLGDGNTKGILCEVKPTTIIGTNNLTWF